MALKDDIKAIVKLITPTPPEFFFGTEDEFNVAVDDIDLTNGVFFMYALQGVGFAATVSNSTDNVFSIFVAILYKIEYDAVNTSQAQPLDNQAIELLNQFMVKLKNYRGDNGGKVFRVNVKDKAQIKPCLFNYADVNLYGRSLGLDLPTIYNTKYC